MKKLLFMLALLLSLNVFAQDEAAGHEDVEDEMYNSKAVTLEKNNREFTIQLQSNPTTGYSWFLKDYDDRFIEPVSHHFVAPKDQHIGAGGIETWTFKATKKAFIVPQMTQITFVYAQPWNLDSISDNVITVITH